MSKPICPTCGSGFVVPDSTNGGAGRNVCMNCGARLAVREFYAEAVLPHYNKQILATMGAPMRDLTVTNEIVSRDADKVTYRVTATWPKLYQQEIIANPEGFRTDKRTGNLRPAREFELHPGERLHTDTPPAPIKQYKDD